MLRRQPTAISAGLVIRGLACISTSTLLPQRAAIFDSVSPGVTT
jgi:hypothetical protein